MKIDTDTLKKQVILHLPIFCSFWYLRSWARRCALPPERTPHRNYWGFPKASHWPFRVCGPVQRWTGWWDYAVR